MTDLPYRVARSDSRSGEPRKRAAVAAVAPRVWRVLEADIRSGCTGQPTAKVERIEQELSGD